MIKETACLLMLLCCVLCAAEGRWTASSHGMDVPFRSWQAEGAWAGTGVLAQVPGYNGKGEQKLEAYSLFPQIMMHGILPSSLNASAGSAGR